MKNRILFVVIVLTVVAISSCLNEREKERPAEKKTLIATRYFSGFDLAHDTYNAISAASDGKIYYVLSSQPHDVAGPVSANGEAGRIGEDYRVLCRSIFVDPRDGLVYYSTAEGDIMCYDPEGGTIEKLEDVDLRLDYFGSYDPADAGSMGYNWRAVVWYPKEEVAYGVHGNSGYLFKFDPEERKIEIVDRITSGPSRKSGMYDQFS